MLTITKQSDYAILFLSNLVGKKEYIPLSELIEKTKLPQRFLARIAAELVKNKIVESREGKIGGYKIVTDLKKISLYNFLNIFEKDISFCKCCDAEYSCDYEGICHHHSFLKSKLNKVISKELKRYSLADLLKAK